MNSYTIYCTSEQTKKALELDAPLYRLSMSVDDSHLRDKSIRVEEQDELVDYAIPTAEQMIGYLRTRGFKFSFDDIYNYWAVSYDLKIINKGNSNNKELDAINTALEYLSNN